jgi:hypothetical protein
MYYLTIFDLIHFTLLLGKISKPDDTVKKSDKIMRKSALVCRNKFNSFNFRKILKIN